MRIEERGYRYISFQRRGRVIEAVLNRPDKLNAVDRDMHAELAVLFRDLALDEAADVVVITGAGRAFCAGGDLGWMQEMIDDPALFARAAHEARQILFGQLELEKPLIARVNGPAIGLGASIALMCDLVYAAEDAVFSDPHVSVGLVAGDGGCMVWPHLIGHVRAKRYLLTGDPIGAEEAAAMGLINAAVPAARLERETAELAARLANGAQAAIRWTKRTINLSLLQLAGQSFDAGVAYEMVTNLDADHREAVRAWVEGRSPRFGATRTQGRAPT